MQLLRRRTNGIATNVESFKDGRERLREVLQQTPFEIMTRGGCRVWFLCDGIEEEAPRRAALNLPS